jgi:hypothetical protein
MGLIMTDDGHVRPLRVEDLREVAERDQRIRQLEQLNAALAAQVDRMRLPVRMAQAWCQVDSKATRDGLRYAVITYDRTMAQLAGEGRQQP